MPSLTPDQINQLARDYFQRALDDDETQRLRASKDGGAYIQPQDGQCPVDADQTLIQDVLIEIEDQLASNDFSQVRPQVEAVLAEAGHSDGTDGDTFRLLAQRILRAQAEALRMAYRRRAGDYSVRPRDPLFAWTPTTGAQIDKTTLSPRLSSVMEAFIEAKVRDGKWKPITKKNSVNKLKLFVETLDDPPIDAVTRDDIRKWRETLSNLDLANNSIRLHFKTVSSLFTWAKTEGKATCENPTRGLAPKGEEGTRDAFQPEDLKKLFRSPLYTGHWRADQRHRPGKHLVKDSKYWVPLIALHSGLRVEEIAKLRVKDVREIEGVLCFDVYDTKTDAGNRQVPVHPRLLDLGFCSYVDEQSGERLWPDLRLGSEGKYSERFCQWWPVFRRLIGLDRDGLVFHSFRHTFAGALERAAVPEATVALLMGHRHRSITFGRYGGGKLMTPKDKLEVIKNIDFGVDLAHLIRGDA